MHILNYIFNKLLYILYYNNNKHIQYYSLLIYNYLIFISVDVIEDYNNIINNFKRLKLIYYNRSFIVRRG